jgi:phosphate transport system substrate-binding protein
MASRSRKPEDPAELVFTPVANDGVAVIVHRTNPVRELTREQIVAIYTGATTNWQDVGGDDAPITVVNKAEGRSTLELFCQHYGLENEQIRASVVIGDNEQGIKTVAGNPDAIGYVSIGTAEYDAGHGVPIRLLPQDGVDASIANVANGTFRLARPLNLVTKGEPRGLAKELVDFARDAAQRDIVEQQYFVPLTDR